MNAVVKKRLSLKYVWIIAAIAALFAAWYFIFNPSVAAYSTVGWIVVIAILLWQGNRLLTLQLDRWMPWNKSGNLRFFIHLLLALVFLLVLINITYVVVKIISSTPPTIEQMVVTNFWGTVLFVPLFSIYFSLHFLKHWRQSELAAETMQKEAIRTQLASLKTQLDPHFLFNNLNILSSLVDTDPHRSKLFIEKFAEVYRSLLRSNTDDLIPLSEEMAFIESYIFLLRTRFDHHIQFTVNLKPNAGDRVIPPLTLQLLVENAIKHNDIREEKPLVIHLLQMEDDYLIVSNTLNEKKEKDDRKGSGLLNIQNRYAYFTDKKVKIQKTESHFEVQIPLLELETI